MTVISANQPQDLAATQLRIQFFGISPRSSLGVTLAEQKIHLESVQESAGIKKFLRFDESSNAVTLDLARAGEDHSELVFFVEAGSNDSVSWSVESLLDSMNLQSEGATIGAGETMMVLAFRQKGDDWQITSLEERESGTKQPESPNSEIPSSIQDLELLARGGAKKAQKYANLSILIDMTISMKPHLKNQRIANLISAIQAVGVTSGATTITTDFGGLRSIESEASDELQELVSSVLADQNIWSASAQNLRKLLPEKIKTEKRKSKFFVITDGYFVIDENTLREAESKGHQIELIIVDFDGVKVLMTSSPSLRVVELDSTVSSGKEFLDRINV